MKNSIGINLILNKKENNNYNLKILEDQLEDLIIYLKELFSKRLYKIVLQEINKRMKKYKICSRNWELTIISIKSKLKIIKNKIFKYNLNNHSQTKVQINRCKIYFDEIKEEFLELFNNNDLENKKLIKNLDLIEEILLCYSKYIYISALFNKRMGNYIQSLNYLILIINFYKESYLIIKSSNTLFNIQKCYILLSQILLCNKDFETLLILLNTAISICFKNILFDVNDINNGILIENYKDIKDSQIMASIKDLNLKKIFLNIVIIFLYKGICHENLGDIKKSSECFKQCNWFSEKFLKNDKKYIFFSSFIYNINKKYIEFCSSLDNFNKIINYYEKKDKENAELEKHKNNNTFINYTKYYYSNDKYRDLIKKIDKMNIREIDTVSRFYQKKNIKCLNSLKREGEYKNIYLNNIRLLEAYLRKDFQSIIIDMDKIKLFDLDYDTRERIQKKIYRTNFDKIMKENKKEKIRKAKSKPIINLKSPKNKMGISIIKFPLTERKIKNYKSMEISPSKPKKNIFKINYNSISKENKKYNKDSNLIKDISLSKSINSDYSERNTSKKIKSKISTKINKNKRAFDYFFNKNYLKKRDFIKKIEDKELSFQKLFLQSKIKIKPQIPSTDETIIKRDAKNCFNKLRLLSNIKNENDETIKSIRSEENSIMEDSYFKKSIVNYFKNKKREKNNKEKLFNSDYEIQKNNETILDKLNETISIINRIEAKKNKDSIYKILINKKTSNIKRFKSISPMNRSSKLILSSNKILHKKIIK